jgi:hypothetical protein
MQAAIAAMTRQLGASGHPAEAEDHCGARVDRPGVLLQFRLFPDMLPFWRQVTIACDHGQGRGATGLRARGALIAGHRDQLRELRERIDRDSA